MSRFKRSWRQFARGVPGHRFEARYEQAARERGRTGWWMRIAMWVGALLAILIGIVEIVFPGPAIAFFALAGALLATQFRPVARFMDGAEIRLRAVAGSLRRRWHHWSLLARAIIVVAITSAAAGGAYTTYLVLLR